MTIKKVKKVAGQLAKASKLHGKQSETLDDYLKSTKKMARGGGLFTKRGVLRGTKNAKY
tara:strand:- start:883 stop:1059 length:177 start_codon:yes stop_codon:yes gene_type:complete